MSNDNKLIENEFLILDKINDEKDALLKRIQSLSSFLYTESFYKLDPPQQVLLQVEYSAMGTYFLCLSERINQWK